MPADHGSRDEPAPLPRQETVAGGLAVVDVNQPPAADLSAPSNNGAGDNARNPRRSRKRGAAYMAQSPQLYKQMAIASDMGRVFEIAGLT